MTDPNHCELYGCLRTKKKGAVMDLTLESGQRTLEVCADHEKMFQTLQPGTYTVGPTYRGDVELRLHPVPRGDPDA